LLSITCAPIDILPPIKRLALPVLPVEEKIIYNTKVGAPGRNTGPVAGSWILYTCTTTEQEFCKLTEAPINER
jgi:hypothetical protein